MPAVDAADSERASPSYASRGQGIRDSVGDFSRAWGDQGRWILALRWAALFATIPVGEHR
jgi:hypothetical protein